MNHKKTFVISTIIGIVFVLIALYTDFGYYSTLLFACGYGIILNSILHIISLMYWQNPKRRTAYEKKLQEEHINKVDERKQYLRMKSGYITYQIMTFALLILSFILALFQVNTWFITIVFLTFIFQWIVSIIVTYTLEKRF